MTSKFPSIGLLFDAFAGQKAPIWHLDRPFDINPAGGTQYTVDQIGDLVKKASGALYAAGLRAGDRLAIIKDNHYDVFLLACAANRIGALPAMISYTIEPGILVQMMDRLKPKVLVASPGTLTAATKAGIDLVGPETRVLVAGKGADDFDGDQTRVSALLGEPAPAPTPPAAHEPMIATHTSGTTGVPKFVVHSKNTVLGSATKLETMKIPFLSTRKTDTIASGVAFVHGRTVTWSAAQLKLPPGKVVVLADSEVETVVPMLRKFPPTTLETSPNVFQRWENLTRTEPSLFHTVRAYISTFDMIHPRTVKSFLEATKQRMPVWGQVWGQSEVGPATLGVYTLRKLAKAYGSKESVTSDVGRPIPFITKLKVVDPETRQDVPNGQQGLVMVKTGARCLTYLGEEDRWREKVWDGWWNTGDIGIRSRSGKVRIIDREVDIIPGTSGLQLESVLMERLPETSEVIILGVPGRPPVPVLGLEDGRLDPAAWTKATADLPPLDEPVIIKWDDFPRTGTWKVRRPVLREQLFETKETFGTGRWT
jgi:acyl-coenzyme A synthetase/AMP-(fatty) acid ligase